MAEDVERTEPPTPKRRREAQSEGQIAISTDAFVFGNLLAVTLALFWIGSTALATGLGTMRALWQPRDHFDAAVAVELLTTAFGAGARILLPILAAAMAGGIAVGMFQTRGNIAQKRLKPKPSNLNPAKAVSRIFKKQGPMELVKSILKVTVAGGMIGFAIERHLESYFGLSRLPLLRIADFQLGVVLEVFFIGCLALLLIAAIDYAYQLWQTEKGLKMSRQEVKDEMRQSQGDPQVKSRMRSLQLERARTRMMEAVPDADVVVTNPQHLSVALKYQRGDMIAPMVVAKGAGILAFRIREIARDAGVPLVENKPLARTLYRSVKVGQSVPEKLYQAVAEVLAYVYRLDAARSRAW